MELSRWRLTVTGMDILLVHKFRCSSWFLVCWCGPGPQAQQAEKNGAQRGVLLHSSQIGGGLQRIWCVYLSLVEHTCIESRTGVRDLPTCSIWVA